MAQLDEVMMQLQSTDARLRDCFDDGEEAELRTARRALVARLSHVTSADSISLGLGLAFVRTCLEAPPPDVVAATRMTKKLLSTQRETQVAVPLYVRKKAKKSSPPHRLSGPADVVPSNVQEL